MLFGICVVLERSCDWKFDSYIHEKVVEALKHCAYCGWNTMFLAFLLMPIISIFDQYFRRAFSFLNAGTRETRKFRRKTR